MNVWSVANDDTPPGLDSWCVFLHFHAHTVLTAAASSGCDSHGSTGPFAGFARSASSSPAESCLKPINILVPRVPSVFFAEECGLSACRRRQHARNSIQWPEPLLTIAPPMLQNTMMLPLSHTGPTEMIDRCNPVFWAQLESRSPS